AKLNHANSLCPNHRLRPKGRWGPAPGPSSQVLKFYRFYKKEIGVLWWRSLELPVPQQLLDASLTASLQLLHDSLQLPHRPPTALLRSRTSSSASSWRRIRS